jgi:hypothetical protein
MNLRWLKITLRVIAAILLVVAVVRFAFGGVSFRTQEQATVNGVTIDHVIEFGHSSIIIPLVALLLFAFSFVLPSKSV